jgi:hypothetical protein
VVVIHILDIQIQRPSCTDVKVGWQMPNMVEKSFLVIFVSWVMVQCDD